MSLFVQLRDEAEAVKDERFMRFPIIDGERAKSLEDVETRHIKRQYQAPRLVLGDLSNAHNSVLVGFSPDSISGDLDNLIKNTIQPWMKSCREQHQYHDDCGSSDDAKVLPTRLIDLGTSETETIKIITTNKSEIGIDSPYLILSYCWGKGNASAMTTIHNFEERSRGFSMASLPQTLQDAMSITRRLGFQYIWIDAMCIIQATDDDAGDFSTEATKMGDYYANAECCIAASLASDSSQGFLTERLLGRYPIQPVAIQLSSTTSNDDNNSNDEEGGKIPKSQILLAVEAEYNLHDVLNNTPLMSRGWYLQELMLSRRIIHWTQHGIFLQCRSSVFIEGQVGNWTSQNAAFNPRSILALPKEKTISYEGWYQLIDNFSQKALTFESDRMYAIHGVAAQFVQRLGMEYSHGVFRQHLAQGLTWYTYGQKPLPAEPHRECAESKERELTMEKSLFPSWCWASNCPVKFVSIDESAAFIRDDHPRRPRHFPTYPGHLALDNQDATADAGALYLRAPLLQVEIKLAKGRMDAATIAITDKNKHKYKSNDEASKERVFEGTASWNQDAKLQVKGFPSPSNPEASSPLGSEESVIVTWLLIGALKQNPPVEGSYRGLLVHKTPDEKEEATYRRYGLMQVYCPPERTDVRIEDCFDDLTEIVLR